MERTEKMRSLSHSLVVLFVVALYLISHSADGDVSFNLNDPTSENYIDFIENVRRALQPVLPRKVCGIPVLQETASGSARYLLVHLTSEKEHTITLGIDVVNVYVVGYKAGNQSYYLNDAPSEAYKFLFQDTTRNKLRYNGSYKSLEKAASENRKRVDLGISEIGIAIENIFHNKNFNSVAKAFLVLIQAVAEASRFKHIQEMISINVYTKFLPDPLFTSLENKWAALSEQILTAEKNNEDQFHRPVALRNAHGHILYVNNTDSQIVKDMGLLLYKKVKLIYDHDEDERDAAAVSKISVGVGGDQIISTAAAAAAMETVSYRYSYTHRKSFLNLASDAIAVM